MSNNLLQLQNGYKQYGSKILFEDASLAINGDEHVGIIGPNGAGKSTLFKILLGLEELDSGVIVKARNTKVAYLSQQDHWDESETGQSYLEKNCSMPMWQLEQIAPSLGLNLDYFSKRMLSLSGGYRMRFKILGLVGQEPDLMLLDEPTNYLDLETTLVLERFLQSYEKAFLLISHDREFLKRTTDVTVEVESREITKYPGNIDDYFEQKALLRSQLEAQAQSQADKRKTVLDFVARFGAKATKAKQAQSRLKSLDRMETIELKEIPTRATIRIPEPDRVGKTMVTLKGGAFGYDGRAIVASEDLYLGRAERLAVVGFNGAGKSTLLKGLAGSLAPIKGTLTLGYEVKVGYFAQHVAEALDPEQTVYEALNNDYGTSITPQMIKDLAGSLLFSGDDIRKKIKVLSGGEKARVALGQILLMRAGVLILDEPTNHLDFDTVEALVKALAKFEGVVVFVSHDRGFVSRLSTKLLSVERVSDQAPSRAIVYLKSYDEYLFETSQKIFQSTETKTTATSAKKSSTGSSGQRNNETRLSGKAMEKAVLKIEKRLSQIAIQMREVSASLEVSEIPDHERNTLLETLSQLHEESTKLEDEWMLMNESS